MNELQGTHFWSLWTGQFLAGAQSVILSALESSAKTAKPTEMQVSRAAVENLAGIVDKFLTTYTQALVLDQQEADDDDRMKQLEQALRELHECTTAHDLSDALHRSAHLIVEKP